MPALTPPSVTSQRTADTFRLQLLERHAAAQKAGKTQTDVTKLPFSIQMEVVADSSSVQRMFADARMKWTATSASGD